MEHKKLDNDKKGERTRRRTTERWERGGRQRGEGDRERDVFVELNIPEDSCIH